LANLHSQLVADLVAADPAATFVPGEDLDVGRLHVGGINACLRQGVRDPGERAVRTPQGFFDGCAATLGAEVGAQHVRHAEHLASAADEYSLSGPVGLVGSAATAVDVVERLPSSQAESATRTTAAPRRIRGDRVSDITTSARCWVADVMRGRLLPVSTASG
jgi:hypothetical protein